MVKAGEPIEIQDRFPENWTFVILYLCYQVIGLVDVDDRHGDSIREDNHMLTSADLHRDTSMPSFLLGTVLLEKGKIVSIRINRQLMCKAYS